MLFTLFIFSYLFIYVTRLMCSPLASNFWSTPVLVHKGLKHGVMTSLPWKTGLQSWVIHHCTCTFSWLQMKVLQRFPLRRFDQLYVDPIIQWSHRFIQLSGVCVTGLMCSPLAGNVWSTPVLVHKGLIHGVMTSLPWQTGLQSWVLHHCTCMFSWLHIFYMTYHCVVHCQIW